METMPPSPRSAGPEKPPPPPPFALQYLSDLHLNFAPSPQSPREPSYDFSFPALAPYLLLSGDVGSLADSDLPVYRDFLRRQTARFRRVFLVLGNHEFFGLGFGEEGEGVKDGYDEGVDRAKQLEREEGLDGGRLVVLDRGRVDLHLDLNGREISDVDREGEGVEGHKITVLGCTLWSSIPPAQEIRDAVVGKCKDHWRIGGWSVERHNGLHERDLAWLRGEVRSLTTHSDFSPPSSPSSERMDGKKNKRTVIVATHHAPLNTGTSRPRDAANPWSSAFSTDVLERDRDDGDGGFDWGAVGYWVFGHTHYTNEFDWDAGRGGGVIRVVSNQRGYVVPGGGGEKNEREEGETKHVFNARRVIRIP